MDRKIKSLEDALRRSDAAIAAMLKKGSLTEAKSDTLDALLFVRRNILEKLHKQSNLGSDVRGLREAHIQQVYDSQVVAWPVSSMADDDEGDMGGANHPPMHGFSEGADVEDDEAHPIEQCPVCANHITGSATSCWRCGAVGF
jgi:hypothetical protein